MRIQTLILGFKELKSDKYEGYETFKQMVIRLYDFSMAVNQNISEKKIKFIYFMILWFLCSCN